MPEQFDEAIRQYVDALGRMVPGSWQTELLVSVERGTVEVLIESFKGDVDGRPDLVTLTEFKKTKSGYRVVNHNFTVPPALRGQQYSNVINKITADQLIRIGGSEISLTADYSVGGYKWLRDGFWPVGGKASLDDIARKSGADKYLVDRWLKLSTDEAQIILQHPILGARYEQIFAGAHIEKMVADVSHAPTYAAVTGQSRQSANDLLKSQLIKRQIELSRAGNTLSADLFEILGRTDDEIAAKIRRLIKKGNGARTPEWQRLEALREAIYKIRMEGWKSVGAEFKQNAVALAYAEASAFSDDIQTLLPVDIDTVLPSRQLLRSVVTSKPMQGQLLTNWVAGVAEADVRRIVNSVQTGLTIGASTEKIISEIFDDGIANITKNQLRTIVRTAIHTIASDARAAFIDQNKTLVSKERFVATLDGRTSPQCRALDGKIFSAGDGPKPPLHFNCRSMRVMHFNAYSLADRPSAPYLERELVSEYAAKQNLGKIRSRASLPRGHKTAFDKWATAQKRNIIGQVSADQSYQKWLAKQTIAFQNGVLGKTKGELFRKGGLTLDKFVDSYGRELSLTDLYAKYPSAFEKANINL